MIDLILLSLSILLFIYLFYTLFNPEDF
ncbi:MAG: K(+)-transporting ATPase subunit F [Bacteriovoracaceae bacterium]|nr:K(+)-transporting ATPase subunit F [Bacteriovoracaceae bacterium]